MKYLFIILILVIKGYGSTYTVVGTPAIIPSTATVVMTYMSTMTLRGQIDFLDIKLNENYNNETKSTLHNKQRVLLYKRKFPFKQMGAISFRINKYD